MEISMLINIFRLIKRIDETNLDLESLMNLKKDLLNFLLEDLENKDELYKEYIKNRDLDFKTYRIKEEIELAYIDSIAKERELKNNSFDVETTLKECFDFIQENELNLKGKNDE